MAAGISTIGLQTKRLSGTQWKKLIRERKMREGTWTVEKPPRKTPPSQVKGTAGSSGGVKRPHSDSSTPSLEKQQPKKPRNNQMQTETYKEAVTGIKMAIIHRHHPTAKLDQTQIDIIQAKLLTAVDANPLGEIPPQFLTCTGSILDHVCKRIHKGLVNANYQWTWGALGGRRADCG